MIYSKFLKLQASIHTTASNSFIQEECHVMFAAVLLIAVMPISSGGDLGSEISRLEKQMRYLVIS